MDALLLALRGLLARRGTSAVVVAVGLFATAAAATGPLYLAAAGESVLRDTLRAAPVAATGIEVRRETTAGRLAADVVERAVDDAVAGEAAYPVRTTALEQDGTVLVAGAEVARTRLTARDGACDRVVVLRGRCPVSAGEVLVSEEGAGVLGVDVGAELRWAGSSAGPLRVVGLYVPRDPRAPYWHGRDYFLATTASGGDGTRVDTLLTDPATLTGLPADDRVRLVVDLPLDAAAVRWDDADRLRALVPAVRERVLEDVALALGDVRELPPAGTPFRFSRLPADRPVVDGYVGPVLDNADRDRDALTLPVLLVLGQLLLLAWFVLYTVVSGATAARAGEVALARLRGTGRAGVLVLALAETLVLLAVAVPLGLLTAWAGVRLLATTALADGVAVPLPGTALAAAGLALAGGAAAAAVASVHVLRTPLPELLRRGTSERAGRAAAVAETALLVAAVAGLVVLQRAGALSRGADEAAGGRAVLALAVPGLLALGAALLGARLLPLACQAASGRLRGTGSWLALRQVARRQAGLRVVLVLGSAFGLAAFAVLAWSVFEGNRSDRALAETGAARVLVVRTAPGTDLRDAVAAADPGGRAAMAVQTSERLGGSVRLVGADLDRYAATGFWRADLGDLDRVVAALRAPGDGPLPALAGSAVPGSTALGRGLDGEEVPVQPVATVAAVPRYGPAALLVDLDRLRARAGDPAGVRSEVWLAPGAGDDVVARLQSAGVVVDRQETAADREQVLARQSPALAVLLLLAGSAVAALLAAGGAVLELHLLGRRRSYEVAALAAVGVRRRSLVRAAVLEQLLLLGTGTAAGVGAGLLAARVVLPGVPEFVDRPVAPPLVVAPDGPVVVALVGGAALLVAAAVAASAVGLVRRAGPSRLREAQA